MKIRFKVEFVRDWVVTKEATMGVNPVNHLRGCIQKIIGPEGRMKTLDLGYTGCDLVLLLDEVSFERFEVRLWQTLEDELQIGKGSREAIIRYERIMDEEEAQEHKRAQMVTTLQKKLDTLLSAQPYKQMLLETQLIASQVSKLGIQRVYNAKAYLFSVDEGCGLTTYLDIFANLVSSLGLFEFSGNPRVMETVVEKNDKDPWLQYSSIGKFKQKLISIDISQWMPYLDQPEFKRFLRRLRTVQKDYIYVFRVPYLEGPALAKVHQAINDAIYTECIPFPQFTYWEYFEYISIPLAKYGFSVAPEAKDEFNKKVMDEKSSGSFYGLRTMRKIAYEMMHRKLLSNAKNNVLDMVIRPEDLTGWVE